MLSGTRQRVELSTRFRKKKKKKIIFQTVAFSCRIINNINIYVNVFFSSSLLTNFLFSFLKDTSSPTMVIQQSWDGIRPGGDYVPTL